MTTDQETRNIKVESGDNIWKTISREYNTLKIYVKEIYFAEDPVEDDVTFTDLGIKDGDRLDVRTDEFIIIHININEYRVRL